MIIIYYPYPHYHQQSRKGLEFTFLFGGREMPLFLKTGKSLGTVLRAYSSSHLEGRGKRITGIQELRDNPGQLNLERTNEWNIKKTGGLGPSAFHREPGGCLTLHSHSLLRIMTFQSWKRFFWNIWPTSSQRHKIQTRVPVRESVMRYCEFWVKGGFCRFPSFHHLQGSFFSWRVSFFVLQVLFIFRTLSAI